MSRHEWLQLLIALPFLILMGMWLIQIPLAMIRGLVRLAKRVTRGKRPGSAWVDYYGERHQLERAKYAAAIKEHGGICMERECIMPSRRIEAGAFWHLAHDHAAGGAHSYLGPAHPECNEHEARQRGVTWAGMDDAPPDRTPAPEVAPVEVEPDVKPAHGASESYASYAESIRSLNDDGDEPTV